MIARIWHAYTTAANADTYETYLLSQIVPGIEREHECTVAVLRQDRPSEEEVQFVTICYFDTLDQIRAFAGQDYERCVVPSYARPLLARYDERAQHFTIRKPAFDPDSQA